MKARIRAELTWGQLVRGKFNTALQVGESDVAVAMRGRNEADTRRLHLHALSGHRGGALWIDAAVVEAKRREAEQLRSRFLNCKEGLEIRARGCATWRCAIR